MAVQSIVKLVNELDDDYDIQVDDWNIGDLQYIIKALEEVIKYRKEV